MLQFTDKPNQLTKRPRKIAITHCPVTILQGCEKAVNYPTRCDIILERRRYFKAVKRKLQKVS